MPKERFFFPEELTEDTVITLEGKELHHLSHVVRISVGEKVEVVNGQGQLSRARVNGLKKRTAELLLEKVEVASPQKRSLILAQAIPRMNRLEFIVEKGTELGMTELWLFEGDQSEKTKITPGQKERLIGITIAALKQCGRLFLPKIVYMPPIKEWPTLKLPLLFGDLDPNAPPLCEMETKNDAIIAIGPESGFSANEQATLINLGGHGVKLHNNILRTDTAALAALTLLS